MLVKQCGQTVVGHSIAVTVSGQCQGLVNEYRRVDRHRTSKLYIIIFFLSKSCIENFVRLIPRESPYIDNLLYLQH
jgi:hypothetical protein